MDPKGASKVAKQQSSGPVSTDPLEIENRKLKARIGELESRLESGTRRARALERRLAFNAKSGLPSQYQLGRDLQIAIDRWNAEGPEKNPACILIVQLGTQFDVLRNSLKSNVSEWILYQIACRLRDLGAPHDRVYHARENEFILVLPGKDSQTLAEFLKRLFAAMDEPHIFAGFNFSVPSTVGAAVYPQHGKTKSLVLQHADIALNAALEQGARFKVFKPDQRSAVVERLELQTNIVKAIESAAVEQIEEQFSLHFQPKLLLEPDPHNLNRLIVNRIDVETLMRWNHPVKGSIPPGNFIPMAEETGLIMPLGKWSIFKLCQGMEDWRKRGLNEIGLSFNLSARQFRSQEMLDILSRQLEERNIDPHLITIELTETSLFDDASTTRKYLHGFKGLGVRVSVDDFGTGYSSLSHLHEFPIDEIKIDRMFIEHFHANRQDRAIVSSLINLTSELGIDLVTEGIENPQTFSILLELGCRGFQGYLFSKALPAQEFEEYYNKIHNQGMTISIPV